MRAYDMKSGAIVWDFDAAHDFKTTNGIRTRSGSFSATRPTIVDGFLYSTSGYSGIPGNVLHAFSPAL
jgi:polyvinyl alcohol dehydrogenase (cytochrome)